MKVLAFDCSGAACSAAVVIDDGVAAQRFVAMERGHAEALLPMIAAVLREAGLAPAAVDLIAVTVGPGSFTGLRIGLAAAHGLALANDIPAIGIASFDTVIAEGDNDLPLIVALESKRAELFLERRDRKDRRLPALVPPEEWAAVVPTGPCRLAGDGAPRLAAALARTDIVVTPGDGGPDPVVLARLGAARWKAGIRAPLLPLYLRAPDTTTPRHAAPAAP